jgi:hypothetical protein
MTVSSRTLSWTGELAQRFELRQLHIGQYRPQLVDQILLSLQALFLDLVEVGALTVGASLLPQCLHLRALLLTLFIEELLDLHFLTRVEVEQEGDLVEIVGAIRARTLIRTGAFLGRTGYHSRKAQHCNG